ncbi:hypothetical protein KF913_25595 [Candidatus Obscuribacterales bacterium]|nr:hypothetical protein [Candidatus Obscuribacterales bacterium]
MTIFIDVVSRLLVHGITIGASILGAAHLLSRFNAPIRQDNNGEAFLQILARYHMRVECHAPCGNDWGYDYFAQSAPFQIIAMIVCTAVIYLGLSLIVGILPGRDESYLRFFMRRLLVVFVIAGTAVSGIYSCVSAAVDRAQFKYNYGLNASPSGANVLTVTEDVVRDRMTGYSPSVGSK